MERRAFIKSCGILCTAGIGLPLLLESCKTIFYAPNIIEGNKITVKKSDFASNSFVIVKNEKLQAPVYLHKINENEYSAVLMICTHRGCELNAAGSNLICPCHGAEFSNTGKVLSPPAEKDLCKYATSSDQENIYIRL
jgi:cytochrome b6-f complex iron-sulfur subunit